MKTMRTRLACLTLTALLMTVPQALAQTDAGLTGGLVISVQPVANWFGRPPYLDEGIGGWTPGVSVGASIIGKNRIAVLAELSATKAFEQLQQGRLVDTRRDAFHSGTSETRYRDTIVSGLAGYT